MAAELNGPIDPRDVSGWDESTALEALDRWAARIPPRTLEEIPLLPGAEALVLGDTHADWPTTEAMATRYLGVPGGKARWIALGDFVDRSPPTLPQGSLRNALYLLSLRAALPDRVVLVRGNHETQRRIPSGMHALRDEAQKLWGNAKVADRIEDLFDRLPLAVRTESGAYLAHAGFPMDPDRDWRAELAGESERTLLEVVWNDVEGSPVCGHRGIDQPPIRSPELAGFLARSGTSVMVRAHDPDMAGQFLFDHRLLTVHSTRVYPRAGLTMAVLPLGSPIRGLSPANLLRESFPPIPSRVR